jgi:hypothetical protein
LEGEILMKTFIFTLLFIVSSSLACWAQTAIDAFDTKINFSKPDEKVWAIVKETDPSENSKGIRMFKHAKIMGNNGTPTEPVISLVYEKVTDTTDVMVYSSNGLRNLQSSLNLTWDALGGYPEYSSDKHSIVYKARYFSGGLTHKSYVCYILYKGTGVVITADAIEDVFSQMDADMRAFIKAVYIQAK